MADATKFIDANKEAVQQRVNMILQILHANHIGPTRTTLAAMQVIGEHFQDEFEGIPAGAGGKEPKDAVNLEHKPADLDDLLEQLEKPKE